MKKRLLAMLMVLMLVVSLLPVGVLAAGTGGTREITSYVTPSYNSDAVSYTHLHVVRRDVYHLRRLHAAAPDGGQDARREDVRGYNEVEAVLLQVFGHDRRHQPVRQVHGRAQGQLPVPLAQAVDRAEQPRSLLHLSLIHI